MTMTINKVTFVGNVGDEPSYQETVRADGTKVQRLTFRLLMNRPKSEGVDAANIVVWGNYAESIAPHVLKGNQVGVVGHLHTSRSEQADGSHKYFTEFHADEVALGAWSQKNQEAQGNAPAPQKQVFKWVRDPQTNKMVKVPTKDAGGKKDNPIEGLTTEQMLELAKQLQALSNAQSAPADDDVVADNPFADEAPTTEADIPY